MTDELNPTPAPVKKAAPKKAVKKVVKKAAVKKAVKKVAKDIVAPKAPKDGLSKPQIRIVALLAKATKPLTRKQISEKAPVDNAFCTEYLGSQDLTVREKNDAKVKSLLTLKYIKSETQDVDGRDTIVYSITATGKAHVEKLKKDGLI